MFPPVIRTEDTNDGILHYSPVSSFCSEIYFISPDEMIHLHILLWMNILCGGREAIHKDCPTTVKFLRFFNVICDDSQALEEKMKGEKLIYWQILF